MSKPTIYKPSIYKGPTVYNNGGGGAPGDFGYGAGVVPTGYRQVAGVYIRDNLHVGGYNAYKRYRLNDVFGISKTDFSGSKFSGRFFIPKTRTYDAEIWFFNLENETTPKARIQIYVASGYHIGGGVLVTHARCGNGSGLGSGVDAGSYINGVVDVSLYEGVGKFGTLDLACTYTPPVTQNSPYVFPFAGYGASYYTYSNNTAVLDSKLYNQDGNLMLHFIPVVRESDEMPGLYELVHDVFLENSYCNVIEKIEE